MENPFREEILEQFRVENAELRTVIVEQRKTLLSYERDEVDRVKKSNSWWTKHKIHFWPCGVTTLLALLVTVPTSFFYSSTPLLVCALAGSITLAATGALSLLAYLLSR